MKRILFLGLVLLLLGSHLYADDAIVMPARVGRFYVAPIYSFAFGEYNNSGHFKDYDGTFSLFNLGLALEFGLTHWITAAVQWVPGWTMWSDLNAVDGVKGVKNSANTNDMPPGFYPYSAIPMPSTSSTNANGVADIFAGAKFQVLGASAPIKNDNFRFAIAPGVIIPLPGPDFNDEFNNILNNNATTVNSMDRHVFATGGRVYFDWIINERFFLNLYNESIFYPVKQSLNRDGPNLAALKHGVQQQAFQSAMERARTPMEAGGVYREAAVTEINQTMAQMGFLTGALDGEVNYKYRLTFEIEPVYTIPLGGGTNLTLGLPFTYIYRPAPSYSVEGMDMLSLALGGAQGLPPSMVENQLLQQAGFVGRKSHVIHVRPGVSLFMMQLPLPLEFKLQYGVPLWGKNDIARHNVNLQVRAYFRI